MTNPNKAKGTAWESDVRDYLNKSLGLLNVHGTISDPFSPLNVRRAAQEGAKDVGDVHAVPFILECKNVASIAVPTFLRQAVVEAKNAGFPYGVAVVKTRGSGVQRGQVHFTVRTWTKVRLQLGFSALDMESAYGFRRSFRGLDTGKWYLSCDLNAFACLLVHIRKAAR